MGYLLRMSQILFTISWLHLYLQTMPQQIVACFSLHENLELLIHEMGNFDNVCNGHMNLLISKRILVGILACTRGTNPKTLPLRTLQEWKKYQIRTLLIICRLRRNQALLRKKNRRVLRAPSHPHPYAWTVMTQSTLITWIVIEMIFFLKIMI